MSQPAGDRLIQKIRNLQESQEGSWWTQTPTEEALCLLVLTGKLTLGLNSSSDAALVVEVVGHLREAVWSCFVLNKLFFWEEKSLKVWVQA